MTESPPVRAHARDRDSIRDIQITPSFVGPSSGSVLYASGNTRLICVATIEAGTPHWLDDDEGWLTADYSLRPYATTPRVPRARDGRVDGRSQEIQRLIGRSLRASVDRRLFPGYTIFVDCDVIQADGGTRTAAISGATVALGLAVRVALEDGRLSEDPRHDLVTAISAGFVAETALLDLDYEEDRRADLDLNIVGTPTGEIVEIQGTSESTPIARDRWQELIDLGTQGLRDVGEELLPWVPPIER